MSTQFWQPVGLRKEGHVAGEEGRLAWRRHAGRAAAPSARRHPHNRTRALTTGRSTSRCSQRTGPAHKKGRGAAGAGVISCSSEGRRCLPLVCWPSQPHVPDCSNAPVRSPGRSRQQAPAGRRWAQSASRRPLRQRSLAAGGRPGRAAGRHPCLLRCSRSIPSTLSRTWSFQVWPPMLSADPPSVPSSVGSPPKLQVGGDRAARQRKGGVIQRRPRPVRQLRQQRCTRGGSGMAGSAPGAAEQELGALAHGEGRLLVVGQAGRQDLHLHYRGRGRGQRCASRATCCTACARSAAGSPCRARPPPARPAARPLLHSR